MVTTEKIKNYITTGLSCTLVEIEGDGHHFYATVVSEHFANKTLLERHRLIKEAVKIHLHSNEIHALSIVKALTPDEYQR